jgi:hypothetical protein
MTSGKLATLTAALTLLVSGASAYVVRSWETDSGSSNRLTRLETVAEMNAGSLSTLTLHVQRLLQTVELVPVHTKNLNALTVQVAALATSCARLTAIVEGLVSKDR